jgi:hypothetical protein
VNLGIRIMLIDCLQISGASGFSLLGGATLRAISILQKETFLLADFY